MRERYLRLTRENFRENGLSSGISPGISFQVAEHRFSGMGKTERGVYKAGANRARLTKHSLLSSNHTFPPQPFCHLRFRSHRLPLPSFTPAASLNSPLLTPFFYYAVPSNPLCIPLRLESDGLLLHSSSFMCACFYYRSLEEKYRVRNENSSNEIYI